MSNLTRKEKRQLESIFGMSSGYVLNFSNRTFSEFIMESTGIEIYDNKYDYSSGSKANRLRAFWELEPNYIVGKLLSDIFDDWDELRDHDTPEQPGQNCIRIAERLKLSPPVPDINAVVPNTNEEDFETLAQTVRDSINQNEPVAGLDRLHTFTVKYFRVICKRHGISSEQKKPLHGLVGEYIKLLKNKGFIESVMAERILKSSIANMESFNHVRNKQTYAHDNEVLGYAEALLIFSHVTSAIRFIESIESRINQEDKEKKLDHSDIPF